MKTCKYCSKEAEVMTDGLCKECLPEVTKAITKHVNTIQESLKLAETTDNEKTYLGLINLVIKSLKTLDREYVSKGINATNFDIQQAIAELEEERNSVSVNQELLH